MKKEIKDTAALSFEKNKTKTTTKKQNGSIYHKHTNAQHWGKKSAVKKHIYN